MTEKQFLKIARALADPTRLSLLRAIVEQGEISCGEVAERFPIAQPTVSHHLNVLLNAGLVEMRKQGQYHLFRACPHALRQFGHSIQQLVEGTQSGESSAPEERLAKTNKEG